MLLVIYYSFPVFLCIPILRLFPFYLSPSLLIFSFICIVFHKLLRHIPLLICHTVFISLSWRISSLCLSSSLSPRALFIPLFLFLSLFHYILCICFLITSLYFFCSVSSYPVSFIFSLATSQLPPFNPQFLTFSFLSSVFLFFLLSVLFYQLSSLSNLLVGPIKVYDSAHPHALPLFLLYPLVSW